MEYERICERDVSAAVRAFRWIRAALLVVLGLGVSLQAIAFPVESREAVLYGGEAVEARTWGKWSHELDGLKFEAQNQAGAWNLWVPTERRNFIDNGVVRARVSVGRRPDFALMFRMDQPTDNFDEVSGYGLAIERGRVHMYRWDEGAVRPIARGANLPKRLPEMLEVVVVLSGPHLVGTVVNPQTGRTLSTVMVSDSKWRHGKVGFRANARQSADTRFHHLGYNRIGNQPQYDPTLDVFGTKVHAWVSGLDAAALPQNPAVQLVGESDGVLELVLANRTLLSTLRNLGARIERTSGFIPRNAIDPEYREVAGLPPIETRHGFDLTRSYKDGPMVEALLSAYHKRYEAITSLRMVGVSRNNRPIWGLRITDNPDDDEQEPMAMLVAAHHGSELMAIEFALDAIDQILSKAYVNGRLNPIIRGLDIWVVPLVNPDGNDCHWNQDESVGRKNCWDVDGDGTVELGEGVDLNRNYPYQWGGLGEVGSKSWARSYYYRGPEPGSEPETRAMMRLANRYHPALVLSWHTAGNMIFSPPTIDDVPIPEPDMPWKVAEELVKGLRRAPLRSRPIEVRRKMYSVDGTDQDWHYFTHGSLAYIVEGPHHNPDRADIRQADIAYVRPILNRGLQRLLQGPRVSGTVRSEDGEPLSATVEIKEIVQRAGEVWNSREFDGRFDRMLAETGVYTVHVTAEGYEDWTRKVQVSGVRTVEVVMKKKAIQGD